MVVILYSVMPALVFPIFWVGFLVQFLSQTHDPKIPPENKYRVNYIMHVAYRLAELEIVAQFSSTTYFCQKGNFRRFNQPIVERLSFGSKI